MMSGIYFKIICQKMRERKKEEEEEKGEEERGQ